MYIILIVVIILLVIYALRWRWIAKRNANLVERYERMIDKAIDRLKKF